VRGEVRIDLPRPRDRHAPRFAALVEHMYTAMTHLDVEVGTPAMGSMGALRGTAAPQPRFPALPHVRAGGISGLLEVLVDRSGSDDIADLTRALRLDVDDLLPILDAAAMLGFARAGDGAVAVTESGWAFADADVLRSKDLFRQEVLAHVPLVETIYRTLQQKGDGSMRDTLFLDILDEHYPDAEAERQFATAVDWSRYAELFEFDADDGCLRLS
jgi:NitT/TauT family transport system ATP-binding protein